ncbi:carboxypeptidase-like regulatory domain-containing protein, partial [Gemmatimonas sp.]|uniref:carboxypeptidase-like regulatory domain-containing protein n=1 Tax=Gemmatimonas sp. TaxID=1962908 RepID=UPI00333F43C8
MVGVAHLGRAGRVAGILSDPLGRPLPNAIVGVAGTGRSARTNDAGRFELVELPSGTQLFEARALGFEPFRTPVNIIDADT